MIKQKLQIKPWKEVFNMLSEDDKVSKFVETMNIIANELKKDKKNYVYYTEFEFGKILIDNGKINLGQFEYDKNDFNVFQSTINDDLNYSPDPLGIIVDGFVEIFVENKCHDSKYRVPLNKINKGEVFGTFGTLDYFFDIEKKHIERDWFVASGNVASLWVATSLHNSNEKALLENNLRPKFNRDSIHIDKWVDFINTYKDDSWKVKVVYFPFHIIKILQEKYSSILFETGWKQSYPLRHVLLSDNTINNIIATEITEILSHDKIFITNLYVYLLSVVNSESKCYIPLIDNKHYFYKVLDNFKNRCSSQVNFHFLPFHLGLISDSEYAILPVRLIPILFNYKIYSLNELLNDLKLVDYYMPDKYKIMNYIEGFGNDGNKTELKDENGNKKKKKSPIEILVQKPAILKSKYLTHTFSIPSDEINLTAKEFSNILLIKRRN